MAGGTSYNGWPCSSNPADIDVQSFGDPYGLPFPGGVRGGDVATVLGYVATQLHYRVEPCVSGWDWGYEYRDNVNNPGNLSCHASATAIDYNAPNHANNNSDRYDGFNDAQVGTIYAILDEVQGAVQWGGDYTGTYDPMHFEIIVDADTLARVAANLPAGGAGGNGDDMPLNDEDIEKIRNVIDERINAHFGANAVSDPGAALNAGVSPRMHLDRQADLAADPG